MIFTDGYWMVADSKEELMKFSRVMGMSAHWFRDKGEIGYFEIFGNMRKLILRTDGVKHIPGPELIIKAKEMMSREKEKKVPEGEKEITSLR